MNGKIPIFFTLLAFVAAPPAGAKGKPPSRKRPTYAVVQMQLQPVAGRLAANARRLAGIRADLSTLVQRKGGGLDESLDDDSARHIQQVAGILAELVLRTDHQVELLELVSLIEIESKHDFFIRRLDQILLVREICRDVLAQIGAHTARIQNNAALRLIERARFVIESSVEQFDDAIGAISALEPAFRAGK